MAIDLRRFDWLPRLQNQNGDVKRLGLLWQHTRTTRLINNSGHLAQAQAALTTRQAEIMFERENGSIKLLALSSKRDSWNSLKGTRTISNAAQYELYILLMEEAQWWCEEGKATMRLGLGFALPLLPALSHMHKRSHAKGRQEFSQFAAKQTCTILQLLLLLLLLLLSHYYYY